MSPIVQDVLFLLAYLNSCLNPVVYGGFYFKNFRKSRSLPQNGFIVRQLAPMMRRQGGETEDTFLESNRRKWRNLWKVTKVSYGKKKTGIDKAIATLLHLKSKRWITVGSVNLLKYNLIKMTRLKRGKNAWLSKRHKIFFSNDKI